MTELNNLGFYGKIPGNGDFVSRHLPHTFVQPWDQWLQESIASSQQQLGDHWLERYLVGPIWRFAISRGVCGDNAWAGLLMPSVDRVGRYFPLTLAAPVNDTYKLLAIADNEEAWFSQAEDIALSALDQNNTLDTLNQRIIELGVPEHLSINNAPQNETTDSSLSSDCWRIAMPAPNSSPNTAPVSASLSSLTEQLLQQHFTDFSLWWSSGSEQVEASLLICRQLPPAHSFSALLTGDWKQWGWDNTFSNQPPTAIPALLQPQPIQANE